MNNSKLDKLITLFNQLFLVQENTVIQGGASEPFYQAATQGSPAVIYFREDFLSSALHEIAHWCIAGRSRRNKDDYGYWYEPDDRSAEQQLEFEKVEVKPQALEWTLALACNHKFHFSADNTNENIQVSDSFKDKVMALKDNYLAGKNLPSRARQLITELERAFNGNKQQEQNIDV
jgi:elongation factor P hydroxylase